MSSSLRKMLNSNRVRKRPPPQQSSSLRKSTPSSSSSPRRAANSSTVAKSSATPSSAPSSTSTESAEDWTLTFDDTSPLPDVGMIAILSDPSLQDVPQSITWSVSHMWAPLPTPEGAATLSATSARAQSFRRQLPPVASSGHVGAVLARTTPAALERETAELRMRGVVRKVEIPRRGRGHGPGGEGLILMDDLENMVRGKVSGETGEMWMRWLKENPMAMAVTVGSSSSRKAAASRKTRGDIVGTSITTVQADELVRTGFLTAGHGDGAFFEETYGSRTADRGTLLSLAAVGRGLTVEEAGVPGVLPPHTVSYAGAHEEEILRVAVPGHGTLLKLADAAVERLAKLLRKTQHREAPESALREWWDGGAAAGPTRRHGRTLIPGMASTPLHRTRKWKEFHGLRFNWVLLEAVGAGVVEVFETGSVGRGVRLLANT